MGKCSLHLFQRVRLIPAVIIRVGNILRTGGEGVSGELVAGMRYAASGQGKKFKVKGRMVPRHIFKTSAALITQKNLKIVTSLILQTVQESVQRG